jgi:hypothetical protein
MGEVALRAAANLGWAQVTNREGHRLATTDTDTLRHRLKDLEPKYQFYQELWHYVDNMSTCLDSKMGDIEECEAQLLDLERSATLAGDRTWHRLEDLAGEVTGRGAEEEKEAGGDQGNAPSLDEFGRDRCVLLS